jgi:hypothetical protein
MRVEFSFPLRENEKIGISVANPQMKQYSTSGFKKFVPYNVSVTTTTTNGQRDCKLFKGDKTRIGQKAPPHIHTKS